VFNEGCRRHSSFPIPSPSPLKDVGSGLPSGIAGEYPKVSNKLLYSPNYSIYFSILFFSLSGRTVTIVLPDDRSLSFTIRSPWITQPGSAIFLPFEFAKKNFSNTLERCRCKCSNVRRNVDNVDIVRLNASSFIRNG